MSWWRMSGSVCLPEGVMTALADLVRAMNCYYSNLIEGHDTHPVDIERALKNDYSADPKSATCSSRPRPISPSSNGSMRAALTAAPPPRTASARFTGAFATCCRMTCSGLEDPRDRRAHARHPRRAAHARCQGRPPHPGQPRRRAALP